ncbi:MAG: polyprenyl synthetase family protein [Burkholderiales bacterium]|nr:polyprenyl synthetase family protein [Burkholderiales bacterium]
MIAAADVLPADVAGIPFADWVRSRLAVFELTAGAALPPAERVPTRLHQAMRYAALGGGKRVRPLLAYAAAELAGGAEEARRPGPAACSVALAVEFVHVYSLIHDDLPCMDDDVLRRGKPTVHVAYDEATAMLAGDALQAEAFRVIADAALPAELRAQLVSLLSHAASTEGMCGGQAIDLAAVGRQLAIDELEQMHRMKTGALLAAAVRMGALAAGADASVAAAAAAYGRALGLAFQIVDDVLDVEGTAESLGKTAGKDARGNKPTYVSVLGLDAAKARAAQLHGEALAALQPLDARARRLRELADLIVGRTS